MDNTKFVQRKPTRLYGFDYSGCGTYFVTVCTQGKKQILSKVIPLQEANNENVGQGLAPAEIKLLPCGKIAGEQLKLLEIRFPCVTVYDYVIMPDHIHAIINIWYEHGTAEASLCPTLSHVVGVFKSLTTRICNRYCHKGKLFQSSFYDHIIRNDKDYEKTSEYIANNPQAWLYKQNYCR